MTFRTGVRDAWFADLSFRPSRAACAGARIAIKRHKELRDMAVRINTPRDWFCKTIENRVALFQEDENCSGWEWRSCKTARRPRSIGYLDGCLSISLLSSTRISLPGCMTIASGRHSNPGTRLKVR